jgi:inorganic pyrophosphatase
MAADEPETSVIEIVVEIPRGSRNKYEFDKQRGVFFLDRVLYSSVHYPTDYGYVPGTLGEDGDPLDVLLIVNEPTFPGCHVMMRPIGMLDMADDRGRDHKILGVPVTDPRFRSITSLESLDPHWLVEIENFFQTYKTLEEKATEINGWQDIAAATRIIQEAIARYADSYESDELP